MAIRIFVEENGTIQGLRSEITPHRLPKNLTWQDMNLGMLVCHQAFIARKSIAPFYLENNLNCRCGLGNYLFETSEKSTVFRYCCGKIFGWWYFKQTTETLFNRPLRSTQKAFWLFRCNHGSYKNYHSRSKVDT